MLAINGLYLSILRKSEETPVSTNGAPMYRIIPFRGFEIHVSLAVSAEDLYDVTFQIKGGSNLGVLGRAGRSIQIHNGPFTRR